MCNLYRNNFLTTVSGYDIALKAFNMFIRKLYYVIYFIDVSVVVLFH